MDPVSLLIALIFGFGARSLNLPPLVGYLAAGSVLHALGEQGGEMIESLADLGVLLLLFTIGLKLRLRNLLAPVIWGGASAHMLSVIMLTAGFFVVLGLVGLDVFAGQHPGALAVVAFALSFSSTVLAVKIFEERREMQARHALVAIGILIVQDVIAVIYLLLADGQPPSVWAFGLLALPLVRPLLTRLMVLSGHGEVLVLFGICVAVAGGALFDVVGMKDGLGALVFGVLLSSHSKSEELSKSLLSFKDFFLIGFFLSIGLIGFPALNDFLLISLLVVVLLPLKMLMYFILLTRFRLRARSAFLAMLGLATFSEFGLIVAAEAAEVGWLSDDWLIMLAFATAISFVVSSALNARAHELYGVFERFLCRFQTAERLPDDVPVDVGDAEVMVMGMGRVGRGAFLALQETCGSEICGIDMDSAKVTKLRGEGYNVRPGDAEDIEFWRQVTRHKLRLVMLALPTHADMMLAARLLKTVGFQGHIGAVAKFEEERDALEQAGVDAAFNYYTEVGTGFADHVLRELEAEQAASGPA